MEVFKQPQYNPVPVEVQVAVLWVVQNGYIDEVPVERTKEYQNRLTEFLTTRKAELLGTIGKEKKLSDELTAALKRFQQASGDNSPLDDTARNRLGKLKELISRFAYIGTYV
jgi:F-type H+-transporting ATPase subunit alpha